MSMQLDRALSETGTRFKVFAQPKFLESFKDPETIRVSIPAKKVLAGPADDRMFVIDAIDKRPLCRQRDTTVPRTSKPTGPAGQGWPLRPPCPGHPRVFRRPHVRRCATRTGHL